jgi:hypothetical protein
MKAAHCKELTDLMKKAEDYEEDMKKKAVERGKHEGIDKDERLRKQGDRFYNNFQ